MDKDNHIYLGGVYKPMEKKQLLTKELASPIFVSMYGLGGYDGPDTDPESVGRITLRGLHGETVKGYQCKDIEAFYQWTPNGPGKGFMGQLMCRFKGSEPHFNHMLRFMQNREAEHFILLPRKNKPYIVIGSGRDDIEIDTRSVEHQTFVLQHAYGIAPFQYYDGDLNVVDCTEYELIENLYIK